VTYLITHRKSHSSGFHPSAHRLSEGKPFSMLTAFDLLLPGLELHGSDLQGTKFASTCGRSGTVETLHMLQQFIDS
jgi:hypothetical protein